MTPNDCQPTGVISTNSQCTDCENRFDCGGVSGSASCWCMNLPAVMPVQSDARCLCPACLSKAIDNVLRTREESEPRPHE